MTTTRTLTRWAGLLATSAIIFAACSTTTGSAAPGGSGGAGASGAPASAIKGTMDEIIAAAKAEGTLTTIALPHDWCNYGEMIEGFKAKYGIAVNELNPDAGSGDEIEAIKANKDNPGPQAPDVIDVGITFGDPAKADGLLQPYKVSTWDTIDPEFKDPEGYWYGDYYSILTFEVNKAAVPNTPQDWADLLKPEYKNQIALAGDPRASSQAYNAVYAAALANGGSLDDAKPGLDFFADLNTKGNFVPTIAKPGTIDTGATPITIRWAYNALSHKDQAAGNPEIEVVVPKAGRFLGAYVQAISAYAPHPNAAALWMEYLYSDEGQAHWLKGYCHTTRLDDLNARGVSADLVAKLPDIEGAVYPTAEQAAAAKDVITTQWDTVVGANVVE
ncbi:MAG TPA: extracellular solute-binding protein [Candidatus Saccharimonadales bacterium]|nr:extracellular solute-binding protein [Candidatus Saccharimonadales bacterium]